MLLDELVENILVEYADLGREEQRIEVVIKGLTVGTLRLGFLKGIL